MLSTWNQSVSQEIIHSLYYLTVITRLVIWNVHDIGNPLLRLKLTINCKWEAKKPFKIRLILWKALFLWEEKHRHWNFLRGTTFQWLHWYDCAIIWEADLSSHKTQAALLNRFRRNPVHNCDKPSSSSCRCDKPSSATQRDARFVSEGRFETCQGEVSQGSEIFNGIPSLWLFNFLEELSAVCIAQKVKR